MHDDELGPIDEEDMRGIGIGCMTVAVLFLGCIAGFFLAGLIVLFVVPLFT
jgi:hypothetical protein